MFWGILMLLQAYVTKFVPFYELEILLFFIMSILCSFNCSLDSEMFGIFDFFRVLFLFSQIFTVNDGTSSILLSFINHWNLNFYLLHILRIKIFEIILIFCKI
ncbi:hypothetical protein ACKWTF_004830 [Chironomus riparius]